MTCKRCQEIDKLLVEKMSEIAKLKTILQECEWADNSGGECDCACPLCGARYRHAKNCALADALKSPNEKDQL